MSLRNFLVLVSFAISIAVGLLLANRGASRVASDDAAEPEVLRIGLSMDTLKEARWQSDRDRFVARAQELGAEVLVQSANSDDAKQIADVKALITSKVDVLVVVPHDGKAMAEAVRLAHEADVPVIAYDRLIRDCDLDLYLSFDNVRVGRLQAQFLVDALRPTPESPAKIIRIYGAPSDNNAALYKQGQDDVLAPLIERRAVEVIFEDWAEDWKPENAKRIVNAAITQHGTDFHAVLASNDGTAGGAIQALSEEGLAGKPLVTGQDAELVAVQRVARGTQTMTIYKPLDTLARGAAETAVKLAKGKPLVATMSTHNGNTDVPSVLFDVVTVTKDNIRDTVVADGFHTEAEIFVDQPADDANAALTP